MDSLSGFSRIPIKRGRKNLEAKTDPLNQKEKFFGYYDLI